MLRRKINCIPLPAAKRILNEPVQSHRAELLHLPKPCYSSACVSAICGDKKSPRSSGKRKKPTRKVASAPQIQSTPVLGNQYVANVAAMETLYIVNVSHEHRGIGIATPIVSVVSGGRSTSKHLSGGVHLCDDFINIFIRAHDHGRENEQCD